MVRITHLKVHAIGTSTTIAVSDVLCCHLSLAVDGV